MKVLFIGGTGTISHKELQKPDPEFDAWTDRMIEAFEKFENNLPKFE